MEYFNKEDLIDWFGEVILSSPLSPMSPESPLDLSSSPTSPKLPMILKGIVHPKMKI